MRIADLREPISIVRGKNTPDVADVGEGTDGANWHFKITPYAEMWAAVDEGAKVPLAGENADASTMHIFVVRADEGFAIGINDLVVWADAFYTVVRILPLKGALDYLEIGTRYFSSSANAGYEVDANGDKPEVDSIPPNDPLFWN